MCRSFFLARQKLRAAQQDHAATSRAVRVRASTVHQKLVYSRSECKPFEIGLNTVWRVRSRPAGSITGADGSHLVIGRKKTDRTWEKYANPGQQPDHKGFHPTPENHANQ